MKAHGGVEVLLHTFFVPEVVTFTSSIDWTGPSESQHPWHNTKISCHHQEFSPNSLVVDAAA
jgi:hypothetical protein